MQTIERTNVFSKMYDILGFSNFWYLPQIKQNKFVILVFWLVILLFYYSFHIR